MLFQIYLLPDLMVFLSWLLVPVGSVLVGQTFCKTVSFSIPLAGGSVGLRSAQRGEDEAVKPLAGVLMGAPWTGAHASKTCAIKEAFIVKMRDLLQRGELVRCKCHRCQRIPIFLPGEPSIIYTI